MGADLTINLLLPDQTWHNMATSELQPQGALLAPSSNHVTLFYIQTKTISLGANCGFIMIDYTSLI